MAKKTKSETTETKTARAADDAATVLLVEDSRDVRAVISLIIAPLGINVVEAGDGREAMQILQSRHVDVVISDLVMPEMSGMMLLHSMLEQGFHVPFILISGHADKDSAIQALRLGAFDFLEKPLDQGDLRAVLKEALAVAREQRRLLGDLRREGSGLHGESVDPRAEIYIMKMRTLRFRDDAAAEAAEIPAETARRTWQELRELFLAEAEPQLVFCEASFDALERHEDPERELAYVARVVQSIRLASEALRVNHIAELAWTVETSLLILRDQAEARAALTPLLRQAVRKLRDKVLALNDPEAQALQKKLEDAAASVKGLPRAGAKRSA